MRIAAFPRQCKTQNGEEGRTLAPALDTSAYWPCLAIRESILNVAATKGCTVLNTHAVCCQASAAQNPRILGGRRSNGIQLAGRMFHSETRVPKPFRSISTESGKRSTNRPVLILLNNLVYSQESSAKILEVYKIGQTRFYAALTICHERGSIRSDPGETI